MDSWELLRRLSASWTATRGRRAVHTQLLPYIAHVLRRPEILQDVLHVLVVVRASTWPTAEGSLVVQAAMGSLDAHISDAGWRDEVKAELAWLHELHVAEATAAAAHLLLAGHDRCVAVDAVRVRLAVVSRVHAAVLAGDRSRHLVVTLSWTCRSERTKVSITNLLGRRNDDVEILLKLLTSLQVPQPHAVHAALGVLRGHVETCALVLAAMDVGAGDHSSARQLQVRSSLASGDGILP